MLGMWDEERKKLDGGPAMEVGEVGDIEAKLSLSGLKTMHLVWFFWFLLVSLSFFGFL